MPLEVVGSSLGCLEVQSCSCAITCWEQLLAEAASAPMYSCNAKFVALSKVVGDDLVTNKAHEMLQKLTELCFHILVER